MSNIPVPGRVLVMHKCRLGVDIVIRVVGDGGEASLFPRRGIVPSWLYWLLDGVCAAWHWRTYCPLIRKQKGVSSIISTVSEREKCLKHGGVWRELELPNDRLWKGWIKTNDKYSFMPISRDDPDGNRDVLGLFCVTQVKFGRGYGRFQLYGCINMGGR